MVSLRLPVGDKMIIILYNMMFKGEYYRVSYGNIKRFVPEEGIACCFQQRLSDAASAVLFIVTVKRKPNIQKPETMRVMFSHF